jgi:hypothetical protein
MTFTYNPNLPNPPDDPADDVAGMQVNTLSTYQLIAVDHGGFNAGGIVNGGYHNIIHFNNPSTRLPPNTDPSNISGIGQLYSKTVGSPSDQQLFYETGNGTITQITAPSGNGLSNVPTILSGTFTATGPFTNIVLLPANVYGYIIFFNSSSPVVQLGQFFTSGTKAYGFSSRYVTNSSSNDDAVELNNSSSSLNLQGMRDDLGTITVSWRLHYWSQ